MLWGPLSLRGDEKLNEACEQRIVSQHCKTDFVDHRMNRGEQCLAVIGRQRVLHSLPHHLSAKLSFVMPSTPIDNIQCA